MWSLQHPSTFKADTLLILTTDEMGEIIKRSTLTNQRHASTNRLGDISRIGDGKTIGASNRDSEPFEY
jgi:hypothetical protein